MTSVPTLALLLIVLGGALYLSAWVRYAALALCALCALYFYRARRTVPPNHCAVLYNARYRQYSLCQPGALYLMPSESLVQAHWQDLNQSSRLTRVDYVPTTPCCYVLRPDVELSIAGLPVTVAVGVTVDFSVTDAVTMVRNGLCALVTLETMVHAYLAKNRPVLLNGMQVLDHTVIAFVNDHLNGLEAQFAADLATHTPGGSMGEFHGITVTRLQVTSVHWPPDYLRAVLSNQTREAATARRQRSLLADTDRQRTLLASGYSASEVQQLELAAAARNTAQFGRQLDLSAVVPLTKQPMAPPSFVPRTATRGRRRIECDEGTY